MEFEFRAAAFQRLAHTVWCFTKSNRKAFPIDLDLDSFSESHKLMVSMINQVNLGTASAYAPTKDKGLLREMVMLVFRAFEEDQTIHEKLVICQSIQSISASVATNCSDPAPLRRGKEAVHLSGEIIKLVKLSRSSQCEDTKPVIEMRCDGRDDYIKVTVQK